MKLIERVCPAGGPGTTRCIRASGDDIRYLLLDGTEGERLGSIVVGDPSCQVTCYAQTIRDIRFADLPEAVQQAIQGSREARGLPPLK